MRYLSGHFGRQQVGAAADALLAGCRDQVVTVAGLLALELLYEELLRLGSTIGDQSVEDGLRTAARRGDVAQQASGS